jgi:hypothetical protein
VRFATNFGGGRLGPFAFKPETAAAGAARGTATLLVAGTTASLGSGEGVTGNGASGTVDSRV